MRRLARFVCPVAWYAALTLSCGRESNSTGTLGSGAGEPAVTGSAAIGGLGGLFVMPAPANSSQTAGASGRAGAASGSGGVAGLDRGAAAGSAGARAAAGGAPTGGVAARAAGAGGSKTAGAGGVAAGSGAPGSGGSSGASGEPASRPCDIYATGSTPCVAAHSTVRALYGAYKGNLYQVRRSDNTTKDIPVIAAGGFADAGVQDSFCADGSCVITILYDQSGHGNHLEYQGQGSSVGGRDKPAPAASESLMVSGQKVYSLYINPGNSYWRDGHTTGVPTGAAPEGMYMVTSGTHVNGGCCFDYGNSETTRNADGAGAMDAIYFGTSCWFGGCSGSGPWVQADLEYGLFPGGSKSWNSKQVAFKHKYVTAMLKNNGTTRFAVKGGNAEAGTLTTLWDGALPSGYSPMKKQGALVLGSGGDCCARNTNQSLGTFYEGAIVSGYPGDETETAIQNNIVAAGYAR